MELSERIKEIREQARASQKEMAEKLSVGLSTYQYYERGERVPPSDFMTKLITIFGINPAWLMTGEGEAKKQKTTPLTASEEQQQFFVNVNQYIANHNKQVIDNMLGRVSRIINEGDIRKTSALQSFLEVLDPKQEGEK